MPHEPADEHADDSYRVTTFHPHRGAPPTMASTELHTSGRDRVVMRALPDLPDDPGSLPISLDTDELVDALAAICSHLDDARPATGSTELHDGQLTIHWYLRDLPAAPVAGDENWLPEDLDPDHVVVWWATPGGGQVPRRDDRSAESRCRRLDLPGLPPPGTLTAAHRLASAEEALDALVADDVAVAELAALTHEGATIGLGPQHHLRTAQAVASASGRSELWTSAAAIGMAHTERIAERILPELSGTDGHDPRRTALTNAILGWVIGLALAAELQPETVSQLVGPIALTLRPHRLLPVDVDGHYTTIVNTLLADDAELLGTLRPADDVRDRVTLTRARRRFRMALACGESRDLQLSAEATIRLRSLTSDRSQLRCLTRVLLDACAAPASSAHDATLDALRPRGLPDALWEVWGATGAEDPRGRDER